MEIVIKISDEDYKRIQDTPDVFNSLTSRAYSAIRNGTPLPEHHGRLGDLDALEKEMINGIKAGNYEEGYERFPHINDMDDCVECVNYADTIIEADKEYEVEIITRGNCMMCGKELVDGLFFCKECENKANDRK